MKAGKYILVAVFSLVLHSAKAQNSAMDTIPWADDIKLTWVDFKGAPDMSLSFDAFTSYSIKFTYNYLSARSINIRLCSYIDRNKSWVKKGKEKDSLLMHEKAHFAIAEVYARKARKAIADTVIQKSDVNEVLSFIYLKVMRECDNREAQYDIETQHSKNSPKQVEWLKKIYEELKSLKDYSTPSVQKTFQ